MTALPASGSAARTASPAPARDSRTGLAHRYREIRDRTELLCAPLSPEDAVVQSMPDASPAKWHLAHTTWFFETFVLSAADPHRKPVDDSYAYLFNSYYNAVGPMHPRPQRGLLTRPTLEQVYAYRDAIDAEIAALLERSDGPDVEAVLDVLELGLHHEQQHQELILTDIKHAFACNPGLPVYREAAPLRSARSAAPIGWHRVEAGLAAIGHHGDGFAFDNERPRHRQFVEAFEIASRPVTNGELSEFIAAGGYEQPDLWLADGWQWRTDNSVAAPLYWEKRHGRWFNFTLAGARDIDPDAPACHVSFYEAYAYARWADARLPTEAEWEIVASGLPVEGNLADAGRFHPEPASSAGPGPVQMFGDVWEWTRSPYSAYPGYREPEGALGEYNGKFMSNQMVLRGGSCATPQSHLRATYRNFFHADARWQFSGLRLARDARD